MVQKITMYKWYWKKKTGLADEYTVSWKNPLGVDVCSMDVKLIGETEHVFNSLLQIANDLKGMFPDCFPSMSDNEDAVTIIDIPALLSSEGSESSDMQDEDIVEFSYGGEITA